MRFGVPDWLGYEIRHKLEKIREKIERLHIKETVNDHPKATLAVALLFVVLLASAVSRIACKPPDPRYQEDKKAWFYDLNTGELFVASGRQFAPIAAPSGPLPDGELAGYRAHVYSYKRDPNESERFVAFIEKPDPNTDPGGLTSDRSNFEEWARGRLIRRVGGDTWISPTSLRGRQIMQSVTHPDVYGQTPIYQVPR